MLLLELFDETGSVGAITFAAADEENVNFFCKGLPVFFVFLHVLMSCKDAYNEAIFFSISFFY